MIKRLVKHINNNGKNLIILSDQGLVSGVNFIVSTILARYLGLDLFGLFALGWMVVLFASSFHQAFIVSPLYTLYPKSDNKPAYASATTSIQLLFTAAVFLVSFAVVEVSVSIYPEWAFGNTSLIIAFTTVAFVMNDYFRRLFFSQQKPAKTLIADIVGYGFQPVILLMLWHNGMLDIRNAFITIGSLLTLSVLIFWIGFYRDGISLNFRPILTQKWHFSKHLIGTALLQWLTGNLFIVIAGSLLGPFAVGAVRMAQNIVGVLHVLFLALENIVPVRSAQIMKRYGEQRMFRHIGKITLIAAVPTFVILLAIALGAGDLIQLLYGSEYLQYKSLLYAFAGLYILVFIGTMVRFVIRTKENNRIILTSYIVGTIASLAIVHPSVTMFGVYGVVIGLFVTQLINISIYLFSLKSQLKWLFR